MVNAPKLRFPEDKLRVSGRSNKPAEMLDNMDISIIK